MVGFTVNAVFISFISINSFQVHIEYNCIIEIIAYVDLVYFEILILIYNCCKVIFPSIIYTYDHWGSYNCVIIDA